MEESRINILENISKHIHLDANEAQHFESLLEKRILNRRQYLLHEGGICKHSAYVSSGLLRAYSIDENGFEHILQFAPGGWWVADMHSLLSGQPAKLNIDALEKTEVLLLSKEKQEQLYLDIPKFERFFRILTENSLVAFRQRVLDNLELSAGERYDRFCMVYPGLINSLPQKHLASYIGVTPQFLSRIRSERRSED
jgi:CRP-like cAMP-binding protein